MIGVDKPFVYKFAVKDGKIENIESPSGKAHFEKPVTQRGEKIYLIADENEIVYVGITRQSLRTRLRIGENPDKSTGYHGYQWLRKDGRYRIIVFMDEALSDPEPIEAEIVYTIRKRTRYWPRAQTEIHFSNVDDDQRQIARNLYRLALKAMKAD
jgi:hypothetical protein